MPYKSLEERRRHNTTRRRIQRARAKERAKAAAEQAGLVAAREAELRESQRVPMRLLEDLCFADHEHRRGETIWVVPGLVWQWEKRQLAVEIQTLEEPPPAKEPAVLYQGEVRSLSEVRAERKAGREEEARRISLLERVRATLGTEDTRKLPAHKPDPAGPWGDKVNE